MRISNLLRALRVDLLAASAVEDRTTQKRLEDLANTVERRFACEGWPILDALSDCYKACQASLCQRGLLPSNQISVLGVSLPSPLSPEAKCALLGYLSWPAKLTFRGESVGLADYDGFKLRSAEASKHVDPSRVLHLSEADRRCIRRLFPFRVGKPKHGPGAVYERLVGWDKWLAIFPGGDPNSIEPFTTPSRCIRMTDVPKDRRKRRLIGIEPCVRQFAQQALADGMRSTPWFRRYICLEDQTRHIAFANVPPLWGSPQRVTVDLSDASDRIGLDLVQHLFPDWYPALAEISSAYAELPAGEVIPLGMMANMGCGFCFELETIIFHLVASISGRISDEEEGIPSGPLTAYATRCRVYGDDIILPERWFLSFSRLASKLGWVISEGKTALTAGYLETCGAHIFPGEFARKRLCPTLSTIDRDGSQRSLWWETTAERLACARAFDDAGFPASAKAIREPVLQAAKYRWNSELQRHEIKLSSRSKDSRVLNVTENLRYHVYWMCGLADQRDEVLHKDIVKYGWVPMWEVLPVTANSETR